MSPRVRTSLYDDEEQGRGHFKVRFYRARLHISKHRVLFWAKSDLQCLLTCELMLRFVYTRTRTGSEFRVRDAHVCPHLYHVFLILCVHGRRST